MALNWQRRQNVPKRWEHSTQLLPCSAQQIIGPKQVVGVYFFIKFKACSNFKPKTLFWIIHLPQRTFIQMFPWWCFHNHRMHRVDSVFRPFILHNHYRNDHNLLFAIKSIREWVYHSPFDHAWLYNNHTFPLRIRLLTCTMLCMKKSWDIWKFRSFQEWKISQKEF